MVWGAMIALWNIAKIEHAKIFDKIDLILERTQTGTVITHVTGIKVMIALAEVDASYYDRLYPVLLQYLKECRPVDFGKRVEDYMVLLNDSNRKDMIDIVKDRFDGLNKNQALRIKKAFKSAGINIAGEI